MPDGAVIGENSEGEVAYSICPDKGQEEVFLFTLYALPEALEPEEGFEARELRDRALQMNGNAGLMGVSYGG